MKNDVSAIPAGKSNYLKRLLFLLVCVLMLGNAVWAQQPTITIHAKNQSLKEVLKEIEQQSKHSFIYSSSTINVNKKVNLDCTKLWNNWEPLPTSLTPFPIIRLCWLRQGNNRLRQQ